MGLKTLGQSLLSAHFTNASVQSVTVCFGDDGHHAVSGDFVIAYQWLA